ncbi:MAG TPA: MmcQ/YjbR family DNA-binding protein, partial [Terriglobales bacterium]|nr:MmcQ/YjbR family DNA-binding protein [Terriglobales bacterium]
MKKPAKETVRKTLRRKIAGKAPAIAGASNDDQEQRVRRICSALPQTTEKLSHGAPTFFVAKKVYATFVNNHHNDGHIAVWIPVAPGLQATL